MSSFDDIKEKLEGKEPSFTGKGCDLHQKWGHWYPLGDYDWGMASIYHFKSGEAFQRCLHRLRLWEKTVRDYPELNIELIPLYEEGEDYIVEMNPPQDGYTPSKYEEHLSLGGFMPPERYEELIHGIRETTQRIMKSASPEVCDLLQQNIVEPSSSLFRAEDSSCWILYRLDVSLVFES